MTPEQNLDLQPMGESTSQAIARHGIRSISRAAETMGGAGGDIQQLARAGVSGLSNLGVTAAESLAGKELPTLRNFSEIVAKASTPQFLPSTEDIKKSSEKHTQGLTKAQGRSEEFSDNVISDLTSLLMGGGKPGAQTILRGLGSSVVGNITKEALKDAGVGNFGQYLGKTGTMILSAMFNPKGAKNYITDLYKQRDATIPKGTIVATSSINPFVNQVEKDLSKGIATEAKSSIKKTLTNLKSKIASGYVELEEILQMKKDLNGIRGELIGKNRLAGGTDKMVQQEINHLNKLSNGVESILADYGKNNTEFYRLHQMANTGYSGLEESKFISNFIQKFIPGAQKAKGALKFSDAGLSAVTALFSPGLAVKGYLGLKGAQLMHRIMFNPVLRDYYMKSAAAASKQNASATVKNMNALGGKLQQDALGLIPI